MTEEKGWCCPFCRQISLGVTTDIFRYHYNLTRNSACLERYIESLKVLVVDSPCDNDDNEQVMYDDHSADGDSSKQSEGSASSLPRG